MTKTADIIIIGAGVAGLGAAAFLSGEARVVVLEAEAQPCFHSSGRSAAIYIKSYGPPGVRAATIASEAFFNDPPEGFADAPILGPRGLLYVDYKGGALDALIAEVPGMVAIPPEEAVARVPILKREGIVAASYEDDAQDIDVDLLTGGFRRMARVGGAEIVTNARVSSLAREGGVWRIEAGGEAWEAPVVVNAAGAWASQVAAMAGASAIHIQPKRRSAAILPGPDGVDVNGWPLVADAGEEWYLVPKAGKMMVSPADADPVEAQDIQPDDMVLAMGVDRFEGRVDFQVRRVEHPWAGLRSFSPDGEPVAGSDPAAEGFFWLAGQGGYGIQTAPALCRMAADLILKKDTAINPAPFDPARFG